LAWAITVHKSQGLTFRKAVIDAGDSFAPGQVYVALSRLTSLEGMILRSAVTTQSIRTEPRVAAFFRNKPANEIVEQQLEQEQLSYISIHLLSAFDWATLFEAFQSFAEGIRKHTGRSTAAGMELAVTCLNSCRQQQDTAQAFVRQMRSLLPEAESDGYRRLQQRMEAAAAWFVRQLEEQLIDPISRHLAGPGEGKKYKKPRQEWTVLQMAAAWKRQQIRDALRLVNGLLQGVSAARLLESLAADRIIRDPAVPESESARPSKKMGTRHISLQLYMEGVPIGEIAARRHLAVGTVHGHLASFVATGEIDIKSLVPETKIAPILAAIREIGPTPLAPLQRRLGADYSFGEIQAVLQYAKQLAP
ncbi:MAG TPA: helix-turn-helix domain-containing protein, partial [Puia sp.]|nr:helix-turn-helix domain-containing protein [Puia sp.]